MVSENLLQLFYKMKLIIKFKLFKAFAACGGFFLWHTDDVLVL